MSPAQAFSPGSLVIVCRVTNLTVATRNLSRTWINFWSRIDRKGSACVSVVPLGAPLPAPLGLINLSVTSAALWLFCHLQSQAIEVNYTRALGAVMKHRIIVAFLNQVVDSRGGLCSRLVSTTIVRKNRETSMKSND